MDTKIMKKSHTGETVGGMKKYGMMVERQPLESGITLEGKTIKGKIVLVAGSENKSKRMVV